MNAIALRSSSNVGWRKRAAGARRMTADTSSKSFLAADFNACIQAIAARKDRPAFAALYGHFAPRLRAYLARLGAAPNVSEELTQEAMLAVWRKAPSFDPARAGATTWIFTIARNLRVDHARRDRPARALGPDPSDETDAPPAIDAAMIAAERDDRVRAALASLSKEQAAIVQLVYFHEKPHAEIARTLGLPLGTVKSRVRLALGHLRDLLGDLR